MDPLPIEPERILQLFDAEKQAQFKDLTALDRLEWLAAINQLYWAGVAARQRQQRLQP